MNPLNSPGALKVALAVSVALNLFAVAGGVTLWVTKTKADDKIEAAQTPGRQSTFQEIIAGMDPAVRQRIRAGFRASAMAARPDLDRSRAAEMRGRTRLEHDATALLATLDPADRQALSVILTRRGKGGGGGGAPDPHKAGADDKGSPARDPH